MNCIIEIDSRHGMLLFQSDMSRFSEYAGIFLSVINRTECCCEREKVSVTRPRQSAV